MLFLGLTIAEWGAVIGIISALLALITKAFRAVQKHITAPLVDAMDNLRKELAQTQSTLHAENQQIRTETSQIKEQVQAHDLVLYQLKGDYR